MNLISVVVSLGIAATIGVFFMQSQQDEPQVINYRAGIMEFQDAAIKLSQHPMGTLPMNDAYCGNLDQGFEQRLPANTQWQIEVKGLDCDIAILSITPPAAAADMPILLQAAVKSGINVNAEDNNLRWTHRLYHRTNNDLLGSIKAQLQRNFTSICYRCESSEIAD